MQAHTLRKQRVVVLPTEVDPVGNPNRHQRRGGDRRKRECHQPGPPRKRTRECHEGTMAQDGDACENWVSQHQRKLGRTRTVPAGAGQDSACDVGDQKSGPKEKHHLHRTEP